MTKGVLAFVFGVVFSFKACPEQAIFVTISQVSKQSAELNAASHYVRDCVRGLLQDDSLKGLGMSLLPAGSAEKPDLTVALRASWAPELAAGDIVAARSYLVPRVKAQANAYAGPSNTSLRACLKGSEHLIPLKDLAPPYIALRVDGLAAGDKGYGLVRVVSLQVKAAPNANTELKAAADELGKALRKALGTSPLLETPPAVFWLATAGDLMLDRGADHILLRNGPEGLFGKAAPIFQNADLSVLNLECCLSRRGTKTAKHFRFRAAPESAAALKGANIGAVLLANNHSFDYGPVAFTDTIEALRKAGIGVLGAGENIAEAAAPFVFSLQDPARQGALPVHAFGIGSFPVEKSGWAGQSAAASEHKPGILYAGPESERLLEKQFSDKALDIVVFHGGLEWTHGPDKRTRGIYTGLAKAGADILIGSHPHIVQSFEWVAGKPVFWSLGNFVFSGMENTGGGDKGLLVRLGFYGARLVYIDRFPLTLSGPRTRLSPVP